MTNQVNVVNRGFEYVTQWMTGNYGSAGPGAGGYTIPTVIGWGTANGSNATTTLLPASAPTTTQGTGQWFDVAPFFEAAETRTAGTVSVSGNSNGSGTVTAQVVGTITSLSTQSIGESFMVFSATKPAQTSVATNNITTGTSFTVASHTGFPGSGNYFIQVDNEVMQVTGGQGTNTWTVTRAQNGSAQPSTHLVNTGVTLGNIPGAGGSNPNNGDLFAHAGFIALALNTGDSIQFTWQVGVTS